MLNFPPYWESLKINACMSSPPHMVYVLFLDKELSLHIKLGAGKCFPQFYSDGASANRFYQVCFVFELQRVEAPGQTCLFVCGTLSGWALAQGFKFSTLAGGWGSTIKFSYKHTRPGKVAWYMKTLDSLRMSWILNLVFKIRWQSLVEDVFDLSTQEAGR